jgi:hypothetical protein
MNYISSFCHIKLNKCYVNGKPIHSFNYDSIDDFIKEFYKSLELEYPKFYKMDLLAKIAFLGTELLKNECPEILNYGDDQIALIFSNNNSSALTDVNFLNSYQNGGVPSPSLFVYTLPNILIGEIAIRNKWYGENIFTVAAKFDAKYFANYCRVLLQNKAEAALCGWLEIDEGKIDAFLFFVTKKDLNQLNLPLESKQLLELYKRNYF